MTTHADFGPRGFAPVSDAMQGYRRFLAERDGEPDPYRDTLSRREDFFAGIEARPVRSERRLDRDVYLRNVLRHGIEAELDDEMTWVIATAKANQAERFGVELARLYGRDGAEGNEPESVHIVLQESYHTRILADVVGLFGLPVPQRPPPFTTSAMIHLMVFSPFPPRLTLPLVGMSERLGCVLFRLMRDRGLELFGAEPAVAERIRLLYDEILADELCHVGLVRERLGAFGRRSMEQLYRRLAPRVALQSPETVRVIGRERLLAALAEPFDLSARVAEFPDTAYDFGNATGADEPARIGSARGRRDQDFA